MAITLPLDEMTVQEKLAVMDLIWEDLSRSAEGVPSPDWHAEVLEKRLQRIADGETRFAPWEQAKAEIRKKVS